MCIVRLFFHTPFKVLFVMIEHQQPIPEIILYCEEMATAMT
jgi:hypothetical protein